MFESAALARMSERAPLGARLRPRSFDEVVGQQHLVSEGAAFRRMVETDRLVSSILYGPPGTGKTTLARLVATITGKAFVALSAPSAGVADVRRSLAEAAGRLGEHGQGTILFIDEVHRFSRTQQDSLLEPVEEGLVVFMGATTENPFFALNSPLVSRAVLWRLEPLGDEELVIVVTRGLDACGLAADHETIQAIVRAADGDARSALGIVERASVLADGSTLQASHLAGVMAGRMIHQGPDAHYDQASAFIKSIRGSDPDAGLYWMARMLEGGEDPRFLARRLVILASEDVGMADPQALVVATAAGQAVELVGMPEAALNLAQAVVYLATAPKSNSVTVALSRAREDVRSGPLSVVPAHLVDGHYRGAEVLGDPGAYVYPHDDPRGYVEQEYMPSALRGSRYYEPSERGYEAEIQTRHPGSQQR